MQQLDEYTAATVRDAYLAELERRDRFHARLPYPTTLVTALSGLVVYCAKLLPKMNDDWLFYWLTVSTALLFCVLVFVGYCLVRSYTGYKYQFVATPAEVLQLSEDLRAYYAANHPADADERAVAELRRQLTEQYAAYGTTDLRSNDRRMKFLYRANVSLVVALLLALAALYPAWRATACTQAVQKIEIVNPPKGRVSSDSRR